LLDVADADARHIGAALRLDDDEMLEGEALDRRGHRKARHAEASAELVLVEGRIGRKLARDDRLLERRVDLPGLGFALMPMRLRARRLTQGRDTEVRLVHRSAARSNAIT